jgi:hypothetical protein
LKCDGTRAETRFRLSQKRTTPFKSAGASVQSTTGSRGVRISGSNAGYNMFRGCVKSTGYLLHSPVSPSLPVPCVTVCHHISTGVYKCVELWTGRTASDTSLSYKWQKRDETSSLKSVDVITCWLVRGQLIRELAAVVELRLAGWNRRGWEVNSSVLLSSSDKSKFVMWGGGERKELKGFEAYIVPVLWH